ncbi:MAG TPA: hypothetical protein VEU06_01920 [Micropepsaceae bacterium]|nr:hypothetical protein [Micropepsaceae bacterium]
MRVAALLLFSLAVTSAAAADKWRQYNYLEYSFAINFPASPKSESGTYAGPEGAKLPSHFYSLKNEANLYRVTIADFSKTKMDEKEVVGFAMGRLMEMGEITLDVPTRVDAVDGRQLSVTGNDGTHSSVGLFFYQHRLYLIEGIASDSGSSDPTRFQQSAHFTNDAKKLFGLDTPFGASGHF